MTLAWFIEGIPWWLLRVFRVAVQSAPLQRTSYNRKHLILHPIPQRSVPAEYWNSAYSRSRPMKLRRGVKYAQKLQKESGQCEATDDKCQFGNITPYFSGCWIDNRELCTCTSIVSAPGLTIMNYYDWSIRKFTVDLLLYSECSPSKAVIYHKNFQQLFNVSSVRHRHTCSRCRIFYMKSTAMGLGYKVNNSKHWFILLYQRVLLTLSALAFFSGLRIEE